MNNNTETNQTPIKLYRNPKSGHCHRVELMMAILDLPYETIDLDMANGAHKAASYLKMNPFGQVPAIDDNGLILSDANAIITYLASRYGNESDLIGQSPEEKAHIQRWLSVAAGEIAAGPCAARLVTVFGAGLDHDDAKAKAHTLFGIIEPLLASGDFLVGNRLTIADIAGYSYIAHAPEGGVSLDAYPNIQRWLLTIEAQPRFIGMAKSPIPKLA